NPGDALRFNPTDPNAKHAKLAGRTGEFALYDEFNPMRKILLNPDGTANTTGAGTEFFLNFSPTDGPLDTRWDVAGSQKNTDGDDALFGDLGNDWLVGGTGRDDMFGGWGNDLLNADDDLTTAGGLNNVADTAPSYEDRAYGGAGKDVLIANTGGDRLMDWVGEFNSYLVPFSPFGMATVSRTMQPQLPEYLYALSASDGVDMTRAADAGTDPVRNGEPMGELGVVRQQDAAWKDQTGAPTDPQPGNTSGTQRDVLRSASFNNNQAAGFFAAGGNWTSGGGVYTGSNATGDAISLYYVDQFLPSYFELSTNVKLNASNRNAYLIFDYQSATDFKYAGIDQAANLMRIGQRTSAGWIDTATLSTNLNGANFVLSLVASRTTATLTVGSKSLAYTWSGSPATDALNDGNLALGVHNGSGAFTSLNVQILPRTFTYQITDAFSASPDPSFTAQTGTWAVSNGLFGATPPAGDAALSTRPLNVSAGSYVEFQSTVRADANGTYAGLVYAYTDSNNFFFAAVVAGGANGQVVLGHRSAGVWYIDATAARTVNAGTDYTLLVALDNNPETGGHPVVSLAFGGLTAVSYVYPIQSVGGGLGQGNLRLGLLARNGTASFDNVSVRGDDAAYAGGGTPQLAAAAAPAPADRGSQLTGDQLDPLVRAAVLRWTAAVGPAAAALREASVAVADLPGLMIGQTVGTSIVIDPTAAGYGWYVDPTPLDDSEFAAGDPSPAAGRMDALTVVMHELGHLLGRDDITDEVNPADLMNTTLGAGERRLPAGKPDGAAARGPAAFVVTLQPVPTPPATMTAPVATGHAGNGTPDGPLPHGIQVAAFDRTALERAGGLSLLTVGPMSPGSPPPADAAPAHRLRYDLDSPSFGQRPAGGEDQQIVSLTAPPLDRVVLTFEEGGGDGWDGQDWFDLVRALRQPPGGTF
ncbi:MAG TPA: hypothetical protein VGF55_26665, partial [Gemmataceae bacterium]